MMTSSIYDPIRYIKLDEWNPWMIGNPVPFDKNEAAKLQSMVDSVQQIGHGEAKFAYEIRGHLSNEGDYDVCGLGMTWEVKQVNSEKKQKHFRKTITEGCCNDFRNRIDSIVSQCRRSIDELFASNTCILPSRYTELMSNIESSIVKGNRSSTLIFGRDYKKKRAEGLLDLVSFMNVLKKNMARDDMKIDVLIDGHNVKEITVAEYASIAKLMKIDMLDELKMFSFLSHLQDDVFDEPSLLHDVWNSIDADEMFEADALVFVDRKKGFLPVMRGKFKDFIEFKGTSNKDASFDLRKEFL